ncbi:serpin family protein [Niabella drilacis]|uniref:Serpin B n=1 Tax=Niabella drilacis (strain DSM 25811 / CCM 8410 / CCUG 62505 / LMG 26954 / E90) TaxID=1285928 RepID=A0A1G6UL60_NIADE|nr:serpin family protein [Niabella drilacis]SDD42082.1 serpin B [Niabella drilacis]
MTKWQSFYCAGCAALLLGSCAKSTPGKGEPDPRADQPTPIALSASVRGSQSGFSFSFFKELLKTKQPGENLFVSPLSLHMALSMVANGASGTTREEILHTLQAKDLSPEALNQACRTLLEALPGADPAVTMGLANALFYKNSFPVEAPFLQTLTGYYKAQVSGLSFKPSDLPLINRWASDHTHGKIPKVLDRLDEDLVVLLLNALYFKGVWRVKFDKDQTRPAVFTKADGTSLQVNMMHRTDTVKYATTTDFDAIQKPYGNGQFTLTVLLPKTSAVADLFNQMDPPKWNALQGSFRTMNVGVAIPRFRLQQEFRLNAVLEAMGISKAFDHLAADFSALSRDPSFISFIQQNTFAAVDEEGTEAAAVTTVGVGVTSLPSVPQFICNRPFGIVISENTSQSILFMGRISQPADLP